SGNPAVLRNESCRHYIATKKISHKRHKKHKKEEPQTLSFLFVLFVPFVANLLSSPLDDANPSFGPYGPICSIDFDALPELLIFVANELDRFVVQEALIDAHGERFGIGLRVSERDVDFKLTE